MRKQLSFARLVLSTVFSFIAALVLGCGGSESHSGATTPATVAAITVLPTNQTLAADTAVQFTAIALYTDGSTQDVTAQVTWNSSNTNTALISPGGLALTEIPGTTTITARSGSVTGTATISATLDPAVVTTVAVPSDNQLVTSGNTEQSTAK